MTTGAQLALTATALETAAGASTSANASPAGYWKRIASAAETIAGTTSTANATVHGYMLRAAVALEGVAGTSGTEENRSYNGLLKRIVDALEVQAGAVTVGSFGHRLRVGAQNAVFAAGDPDFASVVGLWPFDEANGATTFADYSTKSRTLTRTGTPTGSNAQAKFGATSLIVPGGTWSYLTTDSSADLTLSGDFTIEMWVRVTSQSKDYAGFFSRAGGDETSGALQFFRYGPTSKWYCTAHDGSFKNLISAGAAALNTWTHLAVDRSGTTMRLYVNGVHDATITTSGTFLGTQAEIGRGNDNGSDNESLNGHLQDLRITKGVARYAGVNFAVPTDFYPRS